MYSVTLCNTTSFLVADQQQQHGQQQQQQQQYRFAQQPQSQFSDPAIMSASFGIPLAPPQETFGHSPQAYAPPPGLAYPPGLPSSVVNDGECSSVLSLRGAACVHAIGCHASRLALPSRVTPGTHVNNQRPLLCFRTSPSAHKLGLFLPSFARSGMFS